ncbi:Ig-like domain-containing protein [Clostridium sp. KNHs214]|uniref:Ig-like domain-containing protein n=1 Tax=Clostridium sp. KNHs214 TaxID=1540257 RepID=UPI00055406A3|nr:Ig-like domain-containing protein [Clostridium sp. KNHs214]
MNIFNTDFKNDFNYILSSIGESIVINDKDVKTALITKGKNSDKLINYKNIQTNYPINTGDIIKYRNKLWIILTEVNETNNTHKSMIRQLPHTMKIYIDNKLHEIPCIIESSNNGVVEGKFIITGDGNLKLTVQDNLITKKIKENMRIIKWGYAWKVIAKSGENKGLTYMYFEKGATNSAYDDMENEIADRWKHEIKHTYKLEFDESDIHIQLANTEKLNVSVTDTYLENGQTLIKTIENPILLYTSENKNVAIVDNTGIITGVGEGSTTINITYIDKYNNKLVKSVNVKVELLESLVVNVKYSDGSGNNLTQFKLGRGYKIISNIPVIWRVEDINNTTTTKWANIIKENETQLDIKITDKWIFNGAESKKVKITATDKNNINNKVEIINNIYSY